MLPLVTVDQFQRSPHLIYEAVDLHSAARPDDIAILNATRGTQLTWRELSRHSTAIAAGLSKAGWRRGDFLATSLPFSTEHVLLEYACFRLGVIHVPLDLRLSASDVQKCVTTVGAKAHVRPENLPEFLVESDDPFPHDVTEHDGAQVIFTTGSTGSPKPALLSHRGITCQNLCLGTGFNFGPGERVLCNLPASHVGGQAELLMTTLYMGGTVVLLETFDPQKSLDAIENYGVTLLGQIPAMFQLEWRTEGYAKRNLQSLRAAVYGGQAVPKSFLEAMLRMAPTIATGLGLTEASGFCTYTELTSDPGRLAGTVGVAMPVYPMAIRREMEADGRAGEELPAGEIGHVCFRGPQTFLGYVNDPEATDRAISKDGWLYTGDMGFADADGLHFSGRAKWVLKPAGYQVFPADIETHIAQLPQVANAGVVGHEHLIWSEGIIAFVEKRAGAELTDAELKKHARSLTSYMRPLHYVILEPGTMPLNRTAKVDVVRLQEMGKEEVARLRARGRWDARAGLPEEEEV